MRNVTPSTPLKSTRADCQIAEGSQVAEGPSTQSTCPDEGRLQSPECVPAEGSVLSDRPFPRLNGSPVDPVSSCLCPPHREESASPGQEGGGIGARGGSELEARGEAGSSPKPSLPR